MNMNVVHSMHVESNDPVVRLTPPFIDKISFTVPVTDPAAQAHLVGCIERYRRDRAIHAPPPRHKAHYAHAVSVPLSSSATLLLQAAPTRQHNKQGSAFARLEFNPSKAGVAGMREFHVIAADLLPDYYVRVARVSRVDVAIDMYGINIFELAIRSRRHQKSQIWFGRRGDFQSIYLGDKKSGSHILAYDKARQLRETKQIEVAEACTRFEARIRTAMALPELVWMKNPFSGLEIFNCPMALFGERREQHQMFLDAVLQRGLHAAWRILPPPMRRTIEVALQQHRCSQWEPEKLWSGWGAAVEVLGFRPQ